MSEPDGCIVDTAPLSILLRDFVTGWKKTRPSTKGQFGAPAARVPGEPLGAYTALAFHTGLRESDIKRVRNPGRHPVTELRVADALVGAIGNPGMFHDGTLTVRPNPRAPADRRAECCGGSEHALTGGLTG